mgnify:CR=1 FL=1
MTEDLPTIQELMKDYDEIENARYDDHHENQMYIDEDYDPAQLTPRYLREDEYSEKLEDELREEMKKFKNRDEIKKLFEDSEEPSAKFYMEKIMEIYDAPENSEGWLRWDFHALT